MVQWVDDAFLAEEIDLGVGEHGCTFDLALLTVDCAILELIRVERDLATSARVSVLRAREGRGWHVQRCIIAQHLRRDQAHLALVGRTFAARVFLTFLP